MDKSTRLIKKRINAEELNSVEYRKSQLDSRKRDIRLFERARLAWDNMHEFREQRARNMRFTYGDQWGDLITTEINGVRKTMTMREYMALEGNIPQQANQIKSQVNTIVGVLIKEQNEPICNAVDRDEQQFGELVTIGLQANNNKNRITMIHKLCAKDFIIGGLGVAKESYGYREGERRREDSWTTYVDPNYVIMETSLRDPRFWDMTMIGCWYRMPFKMLAAEMVKHHSDYQLLKDIYGNAASLFNEGDIQELTQQNDLRNIDFMRPVKLDECCVAEVWTLETKERIRLHDQNEGTLEVIDADDTEMVNAIKAVNRERKTLGLASGMLEKEIPYIDMEYFIDTFWYCRMLAPDGTILWEEESPYPDRMHPFVITAIPFIDGRISGYITDAIDIQLTINRALVLQDWIVRNQVKGFNMIPKQLVPDHMGEEEFVKKSLSMGNFFFYDAEKARGFKPEVFHPGAVHYDATNFIAQARSLIESTTAISGAIQGKQPYAGTSAALYAQQTANSSTPIASLLADIRTFMEDIATKKAKNIVAFYTKERWRQIAGRIDGIFDSENLNLNDIADLEFDVLIKESAETPVYRAIANDYLMNFMAAGAILPEEALEVGYFPFADKLMQKRQARQAEMQAAQQGEMGEGAEIAANEMSSPVETQQYGVPVQSTRPIVQ